MTSTVESDKLKATRTAKFSFSFQQQLLADQTAAARPDTKNPFRNRNDACKRLLRYHVFYQDDVPDYKVQQFDNDFEVLSRHLLQRKENLYRKFQSHMLKLSMQESRPGESVMVNQMFVDTETTQLKQDKEFVAQGGQLYLPSIPDHWIQPNNDENCAGTALDHDLTRKRKCSDSSENHLYSQSKRNDPNEIEMHESSQLMSNSCLQASQPDHNLDNLHNPNENVNSVDDLNDFSKYLSSCGELGPIDDFGLYGTTSSVSNLTNDTSNTPAAFGSMLGLDTNRTDQNNDDSAAANDFMLWRPEDAFACDSNSNLDCKLGPNNNSNGISTSNWGNSFGNQTEDDVAVESILSGTALPSNSNERHTNQVLDTLDLHSLTGLSMPDTMTAKAVKHLNDDDDDDEDEDDDEDDDDEDDDEHDNNEHGLNRHSVTISSAPSIFNGSKMTVNSCSVVSSMVTGTSLEHSSQLPELGSLDTSDLTADMQMASAIDSILDIFVPGGSSGGNGSNVGDQSGSAPSGLMHSGSGMSGSYGFGNISTSTSSNSYRSGHSTGYSMNSSSMMNSQRALMQDFGNDTVLDEAVKSILS